MFLVQQALVAGRVLRILWLVVLAEARMLIVACLRRPGASCQWVCSLQPVPAIHPPAQRWLRPISRGDVEDLSAQCALYFALATT